MTIQPLPTTHEERIEILFNLNPPSKIDSIRSSLGLLIQEYNRNKDESIWSATMCIMAGIDLMAKFKSCSDSSGDVGKRFKDYLKDIMGISSDAEVDVIYALRNSFMHSFGLYTHKGNGGIFIHPRFNMGGCMIVEAQTSTHSIGGVTHYKVHIDILAKKFEDTLKSRLKPQLLSDTSKCNEFKDLFNKYGTDKPLFEGDMWHPICGFKVKTPSQS